MNINKFVEENETLFDQQLISLLFRSYKSEYIEIDHIKIDSLYAYQEYVKNVKNKLDGRLRLEEYISKSNNGIFKFIGYNYLDKKKMSFQLKGGKKNIRNKVKIHNFREGLVNSQNNLNSRLNATIYLLKKYHLLNKQNLIYLTEAVTPFYKLIAKLNGSENVYGSEYLGEDLSPGELIDGIHHEDLTKLSLQTDSLKTIVCLEVLEHIPNYSQAVNEMYRVLSDNGHLVISVPFAFNKYNHVERAELKDGEIIHHMEPEYHGDPVKAEGGILCFRYYGWALLDEMRSIGFKNVSVNLVWSMAHGILGGTHIGIIHAQK